MVEEINKEETEEVSGEQIIPEAEENLETKVEETPEEPVEEETPELEEGTGMPPLDEVVPDTGVDPLAPIQTIPDEESGVVVLDGEAFMVVDNKYVPYDDAQIIFQSRKVLKEVQKLKDLQAVKAKNDAVKKQVKN